MVKVNASYSTRKKKNLTIIYQENEKNDRNFDYYRIGILQLS